MLHMGLRSPVLSATTSPYATYAAGCSCAFNLESIFDLHHAELNETMGLARFGISATVISIPVTSCLHKNTTEVLRKGSLVCRSPSLRPGSHGAYSIPPDPSW